MADIAVCCCEILCRAKRHFISSYAGNSGRENVAHHGAQAYGGAAWAVRKYVIASCEIIYVRGAMAAIPSAQCRRRRGMYYLCNSKLANSAADGARCASWPYHHGHSKCVTK